MLLTLLVPGANLVGHARSGYARSQDSPLAIQQNGRYRPPPHIPERRGRGDAPYAPGHLLLHPAYFSLTAPHALGRANSYRTINEKLDELRLATTKACRLEDAGQLSNAALVPLLKAAATSLHGRPAKLAPAAPAEENVPSTLPLTQQPMRLVLTDWQRDNAAYLARSKQYVDCLVIQAHFGGVPRGGNWYVDSGQGSLGLVCS